MKTRIIILTIVCFAVFIQGCENRKPDLSDGSYAEETQGEILVINETLDKESDKESKPDNAKEIISEEIVSDDNVTEEENSEDEMEAFYIEGISDEVFDRIYGKSYKEDCTVLRDDLRYLHVLHKDKEGITHEGEIIVNKLIAQDILDIMKELYENDYPIEKIRLVDEYDADDEASMQDNNTSSFNFRTVPGSKKLSNHAKGLAIDINPRYNPYIRTKNGQLLISPDNGVEYADRDADYDYKIEKGDMCYNLFKEHGFDWGGEWKNSKDYQHFEKPD